jgi:pimeloyl-ACP methyl ester carboxylesterase
MFGLIERRLLFRPATQAQSWSEPPTDLNARDVWFDLPGGVRAHAWWCEPDGWSPSDGATHYSHGNAGNLSQRAEGVRRWMTLMKQAVLIYDYPGYGRSGGKPGEPGCYASGDAAYDWMVRDRGVMPDRVLLYGGSLGGAVAIELATRRPYRALVLVSAFTSVPDMAKQQYPWLPAGRFIRNRFENPARFRTVRGASSSPTGPLIVSSPIAWGSSSLPRRNTRSASSRWSITTTTTAPAPSSTPS